MIEITLGLISDNIKSFNFLSQQPMPAVIAFKAAHILKKITEEYNLFQETKLKLIKKYADCDSNGNLIIDKDQTVHINKDNLENFNNELTELKNTIIKIDYEKIPLKVFEQMNFTPAQMIIFEGIIQE